jgi:hypothetical protein
MTTEEKITRHLREGAPDRCRAIVSDVVEANAAGGSETVTTTLAARAGELEREFERNLGELQKLI